MVLERATRTASACKPGIWTAAAEPGESELRRFRGDHDTIASRAPETVVGALSRSKRSIHAAECKATAACIRWSSGQVRARPARGGAGWRRLRSEFAGWLVCSRTGGDHRFHEGEEALGVCPFIGVASV